MKRLFFFRALLTVKLMLMTGISAAYGQDLVPGSRYTAARGDGMGGAYMPLGDDGASGLFYQPAAIGKVSKPQFEALNLQLRANGGYLQSVDRQFYKVLSLRDFMPRIQSSQGTPLGVGGTVVSSYSMRGFAFGVLASSDVMATHEGGGQLRYRSRYQLIPSGGVSVPLARGIVRLGYSLQWVNQASGERVISDSDPEMGYNENLPEGSGFSHNFGFALSLPTRFEPSFDLVVRNIGGLNYNTSSSLIPFARNPSGRPADEPMTIDTAFALKPKFGRTGRLNLVLEWRDVSNTSDTIILARLAVGGELSIRDRFFVRGGWGRGYPALGFGLRRDHGELAFAWFSEEIGTSYRDQRNSKFMVHYRINAF